MTARADIDAALRGATEARPPKTANVAVRDPILLDLAVRKDGRAHCGWLRVLPLRAGPVRLKRPAADLRSVGVCANPVLVDDLHVEVETRLVSAD